MPELLHWHPQKNKPLQFLLNLSQSVGFTWSISLTRNLNLGHCLSVCTCSDRAHSFKLLLYHRQCILTVLLFCFRESLAIKIVANVFEILHKLITNLSESLFNQGMHSIPKSTRTDLWSRCCHGFSGSTGGLGWGFCSCTLTLCALCCGRRWCACSFEELSERVGLNIPATTSGEAELQTQYSDAEQTTECVEWMRDAFLHRLTARTAKAKSFISDHKNKGLWTIQRWIGAAKCKANRRHAGCHHSTCFSIHLPI